MKTTSFRLIMILLLISTIVTIGAAPGIQRVVKSQFTGTEYMGAVINPGTMTQEDGRLKIRGLIQLAQEDTTDDRVSGENTIEINANFDAATFSGTMWGKAHLKNSAGAWSVVWVGKRTTQGHSYIQAWGKGEGAYEGLVASWKYTRLNPDTSAPMDISGSIIKTGR